MQLHAFIIAMAFAVPIYKIPNAILKRRLKFQNNK
jgi:hypothetical protein